MKTYHIWLFALFVFQGCGTVRETQNVAEPCHFISNQLLHDYFEQYWPFGGDKNVARIPPRIPLVEAEKKMEGLFKSGKCIDLSDSLIQTHLQDNRGRHWYKTELEAYPSTFKSLLVYQGTDFIVGYNYVVVLSEKGRIQKLHKWGYGK